MLHCSDKRNVFLFLLFSLWMKTSTAASVDASSRTANEPITRMLIFRPWRNQNHPARTQMYKETTRDTIFARLRRRFYVDDDHDALELSNSPSVSEPLVSPSASPRSPSNAATALPVSSRPATSPKASPSELPNKIEDSDENVVQNEVVDNNSSSVTTAIPSSKPSSNPILAPTFPPSSSPMAVPSASPTHAPSSAPMSPSSGPTSSPITEQPTGGPTAPSSAPMSPSSGPTSSPITEQPTGGPTASKTASPSSSGSTSSPITEPPTGGPTTSKTASPSSSGPTSSPITEPPTGGPTASKTPAPSEDPTAAPTSEPTSAQTAMPSAGPTNSSTHGPTSSPTASPSSSPSITTPSSSPTASSTLMPSSSPTSPPTSVPTKTPSNMPSGAPSTLESPSHAPSSSPSSTPSSTPSVSPTSAPTTDLMAPSISPSASPSSDSPSVRPSLSPTASQTSMASASPSKLPSTYPSGKPSAPPSSAQISQSFSPTTVDDDESDTELTVSAENADGETVSTCLEPLPTTSISNVALQRIAIEYEMILSDSNASEQDAQRQLDPIAKRLHEALLQDMLDCQYNNVQDDTMQEAQFHAFHSAPGDILKTNPDNGLIMTCNSGSSNTPCFLASAIFSVEVFYHEPQHQERRQLRQQPQRQGLEISSTIDDSDLVMRFGNELNELFSGDRLLDEHLASLKFNGFYNTAVSTIWDIAGTMPNDNAPSASPSVLQRSGRTDVTEGILSNDEDPALKEQFPARIIIGTAVGAFLIVVAIAFVIAKQSRWRKLNNIVSAVPDSDGVSESSYEESSTSSSSEAEEEEEEEKGSSSLEEYNSELALLSGYGKEVSGSANDESSILIMETDDQLDSMVSNAVPSVPSFKEYSTASLAVNSGDSKEEGIVARFTLTPRSNSAPQPKISQDDRLQNNKRRSVFRRPPFSPASSPGLKMTRKSNDASSKDSFVNTESDEQTAYNGSDDPLGFGVSPSDVMEKIKIKTRYTMP